MLQRACDGQFGEEMMEAAVQEPCGAGGGNKVEVPQADDAGDYEAAPGRRVARVSGCLSRVTEPPPSPRLPGSNLQLSVTERRRG